jgi:hypothetical protein
MENAIVLLVVILAVALLIRSYYRKAKNPPDCGCGCTSCGKDLDCNDEPRQKQNPINEAR